MLNFEMKTISKAVNIITEKFAALMPVLFGQYRIEERGK